MSELEALDRQDEERQGEVDEGGPVEEQVNEREVQVTSEEEEEEEIRKQLTPGELITMHKDGRCTAKPVGPGHVHGGDGRQTCVHDLERRSVCVGKHHTGR